MEKLRKTFMWLSFAFIAIGFGASLWLYTVLRDTTTIVMMIIFFIALIWAEMDSSLCILVEYRA